MKILFKPRNAAKGEKITYRSGDALVAGEEYEIGKTIDGKLAAGLLAAGDAVKVKYEVVVEPVAAAPSGESRKRKSKRERSKGAAREFLGFSAPDGVGETADEVGGD